MADEKKTKAPKTDAKKDAGAPRDSAKVAKPKAEKSASKGEGKAANKLPDGYAPRLRKMYDEVVRAKMIEEFGYKNALEVPRIEKIVLNMGVGEATADSKKLTNAIEALTAISGQKPVARHTSPSGRW